MRGRQIVTSAHIVRDRQAGLRPYGQGHIADGGKTLVIDTPGQEEFAGVSVAELECLITKLGVPVVVKQQMFETRARDGRQSGSWAAYNASWSYHPDNGLDIIVMGR